MKDEFLLKAEENLKAAELLFENRLYNASANRAYYAAFHAAIAALADIGFKTERISHESAQANFDAELIHKRKIYPNQFKSCLPVLQRIRDDADYKTKFVSQKVSSRQLKMAAEFVNAIILEVKNV